MALPEPGSKEAQKGAKTGDQDDKDFDPTPEALIDDMDDERTLEEEEALNQANGAAVQEELDDLKKESEMPIEELLAYYERMRNEAEGEQSSDDDGEYDEDDDEEDDEEEDYDQEAGEDDDLPGKKRRKDDHDPSSDRGSSSSSKETRRSPTNESTNNNPPADSTSQQQYQHKDSNEPKQGSNNDFEQSPTTAKSKSNNTPNQHKQTPLVVSPKTQSSQHSKNFGMIDSSAQTSFNNEILSTTTTHQQTNTCNFYNQHMNQPQQRINQTFYNNQAPDDGGDVQTTRQRQRMTQFNLNEGEDENADEGDGIFKSLLGYDLDDSDDMDEDYSYTDDENCDDERDWRRVIHVGPEHQADVPEGLCEYDNLPPYENEDQLVWKWNSNLTSEQILNYLKQGSLITKRNDVSISPASVPKISYDSMRLYRKRMQDITSISELYPTDHQNQISSTTELSSADNLTDVYMSQSRKRARIEYELEQENATDSVNQVRAINQNQANSKEDNSDSASVDARQELSSEEYFQDEEQLLFLLLKCNFNIDEALRRRKLDPLKYYLHEPMSLWSQEECLGFEYGLRTYGKDFRSIRDNRVPTRTHAEVVAFYYLWKKSERHDVYTNQYKLDRKRSLSHSGTTDYMDKFIEDNESLLNASSSPTPTPTDSTVGGDSLNEGSRQIQAHSFPIGRQTYLLRPLLQDTPVKTHTDSDSCLENKC